MRLFGAGKKKDEIKNGCCVSGKNKFNIKILGSGCRTCHEQYENVEKAVTAMNLAADVEYITDLKQVMSYGVMSMPAIVVNGKVVTMGKLLKEDQVEKLLKEHGC